MGDRLRAGKPFGYFSKSTRLTQPSTLHWAVKLVIINGDGGCGE